jgi:hypothetical protein
VHALSALLVNMRDWLIGCALVITSALSLLLTSIGGGLWASLVLAEFALFLLALALVPYAVAVLVRWSRSALRATFR